MPVKLTSMPINVIGSSGKQINFAYRADLAPNKPFLPSVGDPLYFQSNDGGTRVTISGEVTKVFHGVAINEAFEAMTSGVQIFVDETKKKEGDGDEWPEGWPLP